MNYVITNTERVGFILFYALVLAAAHTIFIPVWICALGFCVAAFFTLRSHKKNIMTADHVTVTPLFGAARIVDKSRISLRKKGNDSTYIIFTFEAILYESKNEIGRIKFEDEQQMKRFLEQTKEHGYRWITTRP